MRLKTLNGAPLRQNLTFREESLIDCIDCHAFNIAERISHRTGTASTSTVTWRHIRVGDQRLRTGWSQPYLPGSGHTYGPGDRDNPFIPTVANTSTLPNPESSLHEATLDLDESFMAETFVEQSLIFHDALLSSQIAQDTAADQSVSSSSFLTTSFGTHASGSSCPSRLDNQALLLQIPPKLTMTSLNSLPSAEHLRSIYPQTPTSNMICVLMAPLQRREVSVRKGAYHMDLYEIVVADDTGSGFKVTLWLHPGRGSNHVLYTAQKPLLQTLEEIRVGDILLLRNIALTSFRTTVYGQSLHPAIARARTSIDILLNSAGLSLFRMDGIADEFLATFRRVKKWARDHVATATSSDARKRRSTATDRKSSGKRRLVASTHDESLPPDTLPPDTLE
ncbi:hypothetical protein ACEQ8H_003241 [Pleosporales sp. CAS-2024a]